MEIYNGSALPTPDALLAFVGAPRRLIFQPGEQLFRFATIVSPTFKGNEIFSSPWWIPPATYRQIAQTAYRTGTSIIEVARSRMAIAAPWNPGMDWLIIVEFKKPVHAWVGPTRPQPLTGAADRSVMLLGNFEQAYVPGLAPSGATTSEAAMLTYFGSAVA
jgi:hypothetical protein